MSGAVHLDGRETHRAHIEQQARKLANWLDRHGVVEGDAVAILMRNDPAYFISIEACRYVGARYVPVNWHATPAEIVAILVDSGAAALIGHADLVEPVRQVLPEGCQLLSLAPPESVTTAYAIAAGGEGERTLEAVLHDVPETTKPPLPFKGAMSYTSGSTGRPKGIQRKPPAGAPDLLAVFKMLAAQFLQLRQGERLLIAAPLYHSAPNGLALFAFYSGLADVHLAARFEPLAFLETIQNERITHAYIVPTMMIRLLKLSQAERDRFDISSLRFAFSSGSACPADVKAAMIAWMGPIFFESYGSSELGFMTLIGSQDAARKPGSVGKVLPGGSIIILDDDLRPAPVGEAGAIYVSVPTMGDFTYSNDEGRLADQRHQGHTTVGDVGYLDEEGFLFISDRKKDMIITGGANVFPAEIEAILIQMPEVLDCAVFGAPDPEFGEMIVAAVQCRPGAGVTLAQVHAFLADKIARFKFPKLVDIHAELPREDSGKVFKQRLRQPYWADRAQKI